MSIPENLDDYETVLVTHDPLYEITVSSVEIIKQFIVDNKFIIYGGTAIDYALRLAGSYLYSDSKLIQFDFDFYSPTNIVASYELTDILCNAGYTQSRAITGVHTTTQRVDVGDNHFLADISYCPKNIYELLPHLNYQGMRFIHPWYQLIDMHSALSFLYDEPPMENVFNRLTKDIKRCNMILEAYPIVVPSYIASPHPTVEVCLQCHNYILSGDLAYALYYKHAIKHPDIIEASITTVDRNVLFAGPIELVSINIEKAMKTIMPNGEYKKYTPSFNLQPAKVVAGDVTIYSTANKLLSVQHLTLDGHTYRVVCFQYLLRHYMAMYYLTSNARYLAYYKSCIAMIPENPINTPFYITTDYYGGRNKSHQYQNAIKYIMHSRDSSVPLPLRPASYKPSMADRWPTIAEEMPDFNIGGEPCDVKIE
jgi:hypothetical protein